MLVKYTARLFPQSNTYAHTFLLHIISELTYRDGRWRGLRGGGGDGCQHLFATAHLKRLIDLIKTSEFIVYNTLRPPPTQHPNVNPSGLPVARFRFCCWFVDSKHSQSTRNMVKKAHVCVCQSLPRFDNWYRSSPSRRVLIKIAHIVMCDCCSPERTGCHGDVKY